MEVPRVENRCAIWFERNENTFMFEGNLSITCRAAVLQSHWGFLLHACLPRSTSPVKLKAPFIFLKEEFGLGVCDQRIARLRRSPSLVGEGVLSTVCNEDLAGVSEECSWFPKQSCHSSWGHSAPVLPQEMQRRALDPCLRMHAWGDPDIHCSPDCPCWHCQPSLASAEGYVLHGNLAECLEPCVLSCRYVGPKTKLRYGHGEWKKEEF